MASTTEQGQNFVGAAASSAVLVSPQAKYRLPHSGHTHCTFRSSHFPALRVQTGDLVQVDTVDYFDGRVTPDAPDTPEPDYETLNQVTGPIYVEGAEPGDVLSVTLHDIRPAGVGVARCYDGSGQLCHLIKGRDRTLRTVFFDLSEDGRVLTLREPNGGTKRIAPVSFSASPMIGAIGVAPEGTDEVRTMPAGTHGGNLDNRFNRIGSTIHLPVYHPGGLLSLGGMRASQGDGEISGTGVEIGGQVLLSCDIIKKADLERSADKSGGVVRCSYPVTETDSHWITHGVVVEDIPQTTIVACEEAARILVHQWDFTPEEAYMFLSVKGDLGLCQTCYPDNGTQIARMVVPKVDACPRPFRCLHQ